MVDTRDDTEWSSRELDGTEGAALEMSSRQGDARRLPGEPCLAPLLLSGLLTWGRCRSKPVDRDGRCCSGVVVVVTARRPCPPAPGPLEEYAARFDDLWCSLAQRRGFREYLAGLLLPRDRNKTLTALAGAEPVVGAQNAAAWRLQFF
jgi:hypothetical protein